MYNSLLAWSLWFKGALQESAGSVQLAEAALLLSESTLWRAKSEFEGSAIRKVEKCSASLSTSTAIACFSAYGAISSVIFGLVDSYHPGLRAYCQQRESYH